MQTRRVSRSEAKKVLTVDVAVQVSRRPGAYDTTRSTLCSWLQIIVHRVRCLRLAASHFETDMSVLFWPFVSSSLSFPAGSCPRRCQWPHLSTFPWTRWLFADGRMSSARHVWRRMHMQHCSRCCGFFLEIETSVWIPGFPFLLHIDWATLVNIRAISHTIKRSSTRGRGLELVTCGQPSNTLRRRLREKPRVARKRFWNREILNRHTEKDVSKRGVLKGC